MHQLKQTRLVLLFVITNFLFCGSLQAQSPSLAIQNAYDIATFRELVAQKFPDFQPRFIIKKLSFEMTREDSLLREDSVVQYWLADTAILHQLTEMILAKGNEESLDVIPSNHSGTNPPGSPDTPSRPGGLPQPRSGKGGLQSLNRKDFFFAPYYRKAAADLREQIGQELVNIFLITDGSSSQIGYSVQIRQKFEILPEAIAALQDETRNYTYIEPHGAEALIGGGFAINEAAIIYGITDWAIRRAKEEMLESVLSRIYDKLQGDEITRTLLANTLKTFERFKEDNSVGLAKYGSLWKASFQEDFRQIPVHLQDEQFVQTIVSRVAPGWAGACEAVSFISGGTSFVYGIYQKKHPVAILEEMATRYLTGATTSGDPLPVFKRTVLLTHVLSTMLGQLKDEVYKCTDVSELKRMDLSRWTYFLRYIYLANRDELRLAMGTTAINFISETQRGPGSTFFNLLTSTITSYQSMQKILSTRVTNNLSTVPDKVLSSEELSNVIALSTAIVQNALPYLAGRVPATVRASLQFIADNWTPIVHSIEQIGEGISTKEYGMALDGTLQLLTYADIEFRRVSGTASTNTLRTSILTTFTRYGSFMVNVLSATSSDAVENALDELIPRGQYRLKSAHDRSISLSLYPGFFGGWEIVKEYDIIGGVPQNTTHRSTKRNFSFFLPIGIDLNQRCGSGSFSLLLQALDLGAVLNYRLVGEGSDQESDPKIGFQQLLSPGVSLLFRFPNSPFVIGSGFNYTPELRKIKTDALTYSTGAFRYGFYAAVDVTAFHLTLSKKKK